ncbi:MAG: ABC-2 transporter permease [Negativicutes bacterium]|nr:ABC-2 transporter permease [Negativicutes bacterium]
MKGLLLKDLINLKSQMKILGLLLLFYIFLAYQNRDLAFLSGMLMILSVMLSITSIAFDERSRWDPYALTMPLSRRQLVFSKYILNLLLIAAGGLIIFGVLPFLGGINQESLLILAVTAASALLINSLLLPIMFKFGVEKGRYILVMLSLIPFVLTMLLPKSLRFDLTVLDQFSSLLAVVFFLFVLGAFAVSLLISVKIMEAKEL